MQQQPISPPYKQFFIITTLMAALLGMTGPTGAQQTFFADTLAGQGWPYPRDLTGVAVASDGTIYLADRGSHTVLRVETHGRLSVFAGTGVAGFSGDGDTAAAAQLDTPTGVALTADESTVYIADRNNHRIRKVDVATRIITTVAGTGNRGFSGDDEPATDADLNTPSEVTVDGDGTVYIADRNNHCIRKVAPSGIITTVAGTGTSGDTGDTGLAAAAQLNQPLGVTLTSDGTLYIADTFNHRIRKVDPSGIITTVVGTGSAGFSGDDGSATVAQLNYPIGVAVASDGTMYIADWGNRRVRKVATDETITTVAGTGTSGGDGFPGPATRAQLHRPYGMAVDSRDNFYIAQSYGGYGWLLKVNTSGTITVVAGGWPRGSSGDSGPATAARLSGPRGVAVDSDGTVYIAESGNRRIRKVDTSGIIYTLKFTESGDFHPFRNVDIEDAYDVAVDSQGNVYIAETADADRVADRRARIRKVATDGTISTVAGTGLWGFSGDGGPATAARLSNSRGVAVDSSGNIYIADTSNRRIRKVDTSGIINTIAGTATSGFSGDGGPATAAQLNGPEDVAVDSSGNVYIADTFNHRIRKVDVSVNPPTISTIAGTGNQGFSGDGGQATAADLNAPRGVAVASDGTVYIADDNHRIRAVATDGTISTVAGTGTASFTPRPGVATAVRIESPGKIAVSSTGAVYVTELFAARVSVLTTNGLPTARDVSTTTPTGTPVTIDLRVSDPNNDPLTITVTTPSNGMATVSDTADTAIDYTPNAGFTGVDTFTYTVSDGQGGSATATVRVRVGTEDGAPTTTDGTGTRRRQPTDHHGNTPATATTLTATAPIARATGFLHYGDQDYFRLTLPHAGLLLVQTSGWANTVCTVWQDDVELGSAELGGRLYNCRLGVSVQAGPVVIRVTERSAAAFGTYGLYARFIAGQIDQPVPTTVQNGLGMVTGWLCSAAAVVLEIDGQPYAPAPLPAPVPPELASVVGVGGSPVPPPAVDPRELCGEAATGFGLPVNWNLLGDGEHTLIARLDDIEFARTVVQVTTLGEEFVHDAQGTCVVPDFPLPDHSVNLVWQEAGQHFALSDGQPPPPASLATASDILGVLETPAPASFQSGWGSISGWVCEAEEVVVEINDTPYPVVYGTDRADTAGGVWRGGDGDRLWAEP